MSRHSLRTGELLRTDHFRVIMDGARSIVYVRRTEAPFETAAECDQEFGDLVRVLQRLNRSKLNVLVDMRVGAPRNDPSFEQIIARHRKKLYAGFAKSAALVQSAAGLLEVSRHAREDGLPVSGFLEESIAIKFLEGERLRS